MLSAHQRGADLVCATPADWRAPVNPLCRYESIAIVIIAVGALLAGCESPVAPNESVSVSTQAVSSPSVQTVELAFYPGTDIKTTALLAAATLKISDSVKIVESSNASAYAPIENTGSASTEVGANAKVGGLVSRADFGAAQQRQGLR
jgi:hypothetical protein